MRSAGTMIISTSSAVGRTDTSRKRVIAPMPSSSVSCILRCASGSNCSVGAWITSSRRVVGAAVLARASRFLAALALRAAVAAAVLDGFGALVAVALGALSCGTSSTSPLMTDYSPRTSGCLSAE